MCKYHAIFRSYDVQTVNIKFKISKVLHTTLLTWLNMRVDILHTCGKHLFDRIISLSGVV